MRFFPWLTEEFTSPLAPDELLRRVQAAIAPPQPPSWRTLFAGPPAEPFRGFVAGISFELSRIITGRNSMLPVITGWVGPDYTTGSRLRLRHRLHAFTLVFAAVWLLLLGSIVLGVLGRLLATGEAEWEGQLGAALIPAGMFVFGLLFFTVPFWLEVNKSRPLLVKLLQLTPAPPS